MERMTNPVNFIKFHQFCTLMERVKKSTKAEEKLALVFNTSLKTTLGKQSLFPYLRLILPEIDRSRTYSIKEKKLVDFYCSILGLGKQTVDGLKLDNWSDPRYVKSYALGDFGLVLEEVLQTRLKSEPSTYTIGEVNARLDELVDADTNTDRQKILMGFARDFSAMEQKWLTRIVLKDMKIGLRHERVIKKIHPDAEEMYNITTDLEAVCKQLVDSEVRYVQSVVPFQVLSPMLAKRVSFSQCVQALNSKDIALEPKLDGERMTCHRRAGEVQFISRNGKNYTELYAPTLGIYINQQIVLDLDFILDGELMVWNSRCYKFEPFGTLKTVALTEKEGTNGYHWVCYVIWDIMYLKGGNAEELIHKAHTEARGITSVMGLPLRARRRLLESVVHEQPHRIELIEHQTLKNESEENTHKRIMEEVDSKIMGGYEGLIAKDLSSHYICGETGRKEQRWIKLKPDYEGITTDLDVVILGGYYGKGKKVAGIVAQFLVGTIGQTIATEKVNPMIASPCPLFFPLCRVGTGFTQKDLELLGEILGPHWISLPEVPDFVGDWTPKLDLRPDVWIDPRKSMLLEIIGAEINYSNQYSGGLTVRFPRCKAIRHDKDWYDCLSLQDLNKLKGSLLNKKKRAVDIQLSKKVEKNKKSSSVFRKRGGYSIMPKFRQADLQNVTPQSELFTGLTFCVFPGHYDDSITVDGKVPTKHSIEALIHQHGGALVQNPTTPESINYIIAAGAGLLRVESFIKSAKFDIIRVSWVVHCVEQSMKLPLQPHDYIFMTTHTKEKMSKEYDVFGDHFWEPTTVTNLRSVMKGMNGTTAHSNTWQAMLHSVLDEEKAVFQTGMTMFCFSVMYFDLYEDVVVSEGEEGLIAEQTDRSSRRMDSEILAALEQKVRLYSGQTTSVISASTSHIIVDIADSKRLERVFKAACEARLKWNREPPIIRIDWISNCIDAGVLLPLNEYHVKSLA